MPLFAVGARSAEAARAAGFSEVVSADGDVDDLIGLLAARFGGSGVRLLYLAGEDRAGDLAASLAAHGIEVETAVVYRAVPDEEFPGRLARRASRPDRSTPCCTIRGAAPRHSFLAGVESAGVLDAALAAVHLCLSAEVAAPLQEAGAAQVRIARGRTNRSLIGLLSPN